MRALPSHLAEWMLIVSRHFTTQDGTLSRMFELEKLSKIKGAEGKA